MCSILQRSAARDDTLDTLCTNIVNAQRLELSELSTTWLHTA